MASEKIETSETVEDSTHLKQEETAVDGTTRLYEDGQLRLIPAPSPHPDDPLNASKLKKGLAIFALCFFGAIAISMQQIVAGMLPIFMLEYAGIDPHVLNSPNGLAGVFASAAGAGGGFPGIPTGASITGIPNGFPTGTAFTGIPTGAFTGFPSGVPTGAFTGIPSGAPSRSSPPIARQATQPTGIPSGIPSGIPTPLPTGFPTGSPPPGFPSGPLPSGFPTGPLPSGFPGGAAPPGGFPGGAFPGPPSGGNPLDALSHLPGAQPLSRVNLLISLPMLMVGLSNYILIPAAIAFGRRTVMIVCVLLATFCTLWSGLSTSLESHIASRCLQAFGAGAVESLIPLILQDMTFVHQRSRAMSVIWASQAIVALPMGIGATYMTARMSWRWLYFIGTIITGVSALCVIIFVPETRWKRSPAELAGQKTYQEVQASRPLIKPSVRARYGILANGGANMRLGALSFVEIIKTLCLPIVVYLILVNAAFIGISLGSNTTMSTVLLAPPYSWPFDAVGYVVIATLVSSIFVMVIGGYASDFLSNRLARRNGGKREAEMNLINLVFPLFCGIFGCILYGIGGQYVYQVHWMAILSGTSILLFAFLTTNIVASVIVIESYPRLAGPVLVNVASFRNIVGFAFTYGIPDWVASRGYMVTFAIFAGVIAFLSLFLPIFFIFGKRFRKSTRFVSESVSSSF